MAVIITGPTMTATLNKNPQPDSGFYIERLNHLSKRLGGGNMHTVSMGPNLCIGDLRLLYVIGDEARELEKLIVNDLLFTLFELTITPPDCYDAGLGFGQPVTCRLNNVKSTSQIIQKANVHDKFSINLSYEFIIPDNKIGIGVNV